MSVSKEKAQAISAEIQSLLEGVFEKHGLEKPTIKMGYGEWFDYKMTSSAIDLGPNGINLSSKEATYYKKFGFQTYGEAPTYWDIKLTAPLGMLFFAGPGLKKQYAFAGVDAKKKKFPIIAKDMETGNMVGFPESIIARLNAEALKQGEK